MIKTVRIFKNHSLISNDTARFLEGRLRDCGFKIVDKNSVDLIISVGGDGTFLKTLKETNFNTKPLYVGVLSGHLGFLQEISPEQIDFFIESIKNEYYKIEKLSIQKATVKTKSKNYSFFALNDTVIREKDLKVLHLDVLIEGNLLEKFAGDGMIVSTPIGSTAYNLSEHGSIVYPSLNVLQITHMAPMNSKSFRSLQNSIIVPPEMTVSLIPGEGYLPNILISVDGNNKKFTNVKEVEIRMDANYIKSVRFENYSFWTRIREKFL